MPKRILIIEDKQNLESSTADFLRAAGFEASSERSWDSAVKRISSEPLDAIILDISLPGIDGFSVCKTVREQFNGPLVVVSPRDDEIDEVVAFEIGANDFLAEPVRPRVLIARLRSHLRHCENTLQMNASSMINVGNLKINASKRSVTIDEHPIAVTSAEFDLLWHLAEHAGKVVERSNMYQTLMGHAYDGIDRTIDLRISRLRKKLGDDPVDPTRIKSVRGVGYILAQ